MPDDPKQPEEVKPSPAIDLILKAVKLDWIRPLIYKVGGRKLVAGGGGLAVINEIVKSDLSDTGKIVACICAAVVAVGTSVAIALEDGRKKEEPK